MMDVDDVVEEENCIISQRDIRDDDVSDGDSQPGVLSDRGLFILVQFILFWGGYSSLLHASGVRDWPHQLLVKLKVSLPVGESLDKINKLLVNGSLSGFLSEHDQMLTWNREEGKYRKLWHIKRVLDSLYEEKSSKFVRHSFSLELSADLFQSSRENSRT